MADTPAEPSGLGWPTFCAGPTNTAPPVFLHTGWRSAGTWLWSRFRAAPNVAAFYEPLNETLGVLSPSVLPRLRADTWPSRHPRLEQPYYQEYAALLRNGVPGVGRFRHQFATRDFFAAAATDLPELRAYLTMLLNHAADQRLQPVLKFCRSMGRVDWMLHNFPNAVHVVVLRNPATQFGSAYWHYVHHAAPYFLAMPMLVLARNRDDLRVAEAVETFGASLPRMPAAANDEVALAACHDHLRETRPETWYRGFLAFWTLCALSIPDSIDCVIDTDLLSLSASYRDVTQRDLTRLTQVPLELGEDDAPCDEAVRASAVLGAPRAAVWRCHQAASVLLAAQGGLNWADTGVGARIGAMLAQANLIAMDGAAVLRAPTFDRITNRHDLLARAERAERALDAVHESFAWRMTHLLHRIQRRLRSSLHRYGGGWRHYAPISGTRWLRNVSAQARQE